MINLFGLCVSASPKLSDISYSDECNVRGGIETLNWIRRRDLNLDIMMGRNLVSGTGITPMVLPENYTELQDWVLGQNAFAAQGAGDSNELLFWGDGSNVIRDITHADYINSPTGADILNPTGVGVMEELGSMEYSNKYVNLTTQCITEYYVNTGCYFATLTFDRKQAFYDFTYTDDADVYEMLLTIIFEGKSKENRNAFCDAISQCGLVLQIFDNNCQQRMMGLEFNASKTLLIDAVERVKIVRHLDSSGQFGTSSARDEVDFGGEQVCPPMYTNVNQAALPTL